MATPHIELDDKSLIAKTVLMPGDPLRAKYIAENFLTDVIMFNKVRNVFGYTGYYKGKRISVMASGMGMPSIGIYSYELFKFYDVENIIRIGSCGAYSKELHIYDVLLAKDAYSESSYAKTMGFSDSHVLSANEELNSLIKQAALKLNIPITECRIHSSDVFYRLPSGVSYKDVRDIHGCMAVEMESFALFANAQALGKKAACLLTVSDCFESDEMTSALERQNSFTKMMEIALELA